MSEQKTFELTPSVSILIAGVIIAGAVVFTSSRSVPATNTQQAQAQAGATTQEQMGPELYATIAKQLGANTDKFASCAASKTYQSKIDADTQEATKNGGQGTPFTLVYDTKTKKASAVSGALPYEQFKAAIAQASASAQIVAVRPPSADDHIIGSPTAPTVLIEYSDFQCPFCKMVDPTLKRIVNESNGQIAWVYRNFPLSSIHPQATPAANAAECIAAQLGNDAFWRFADTIFQ